MDLPINIAEDRISALLSKHVICIRPCGLVGYCPGQKLRTGGGRSDGGRRPTGLLGQISW